MVPSEQSSPCFTREQLENYAQGVLLREVAEACEEHLANCSGCLAVLSELFDSGSEPAWLPAGGGGMEQPSSDGHADNALKKAHAPSTQRAAAHELWQQQAVASSAQRPTAEMHIPETLGRYRIQKVLGSGGFGRVYLAYDEKLKRNVALKVPHLSVAKNQVHWDLMLSEAQTVAALDHPAIVPIFDVASTDEVPMFLVSKLIQGQTLSDRLSTARIVPGDAIPIVLRVAEALEYAHDQGVIHRDIKPQNILLDDSGQVFLSDFGLAWRSATNIRNFPGAGTPHYMSPEQLSESTDCIDQRSDIYSLGRVLQLMLGAYLPAHSSRQGHWSVPISRASDDTGESLLAQPKLSPAQASMPVTYPVELPADLILICEKATATDPAARYQHVRDMRAALQAACQVHRNKRFGLAIR